jgi:putative ABC transport system ATP-binding protein
VTAEPAVLLEGVTRRYGSVEALRGVDLRVERGSLVAIVGPSGSGKTTLLQIVGTLDRATSGTVHIAGEDVARLGDRALSGLRGRHVGFVFQAFHLLNNRSAVENVATGLLYAGVGPRERRRRAAEVLERVGLGHRLRHDPSELSGGERQRVAIARALIGRPTLLLADEPTGNLDTVTGQEIVGLLRELHADGTTVLVITHDRDIASHFSRQVHLRDGLVERDSALDADGQLATRMLAGGRS